MTQAETEPLLRRARLRPDQIIARDADNTSRNGLPHDLEHVKWLADSLRENGQLAEIVVTPTDDPEKFELIYGFGRYAAASILGPVRSEKWDGLLNAQIKTFASKAEREDHNVLENIGQDTLSPIDVGLVGRRYTAAPDDGGRGYSLQIAASKLRQNPNTLRRLMMLTGLIEPFRDQIRRNHRNRETGITVDQGLKLAKRSAEEQHALFNQSKDAGGNVTPKAVRSTIAPHQGRAGQPSNATGATLDKLRGKLGELAGDKDARDRCGFKSAREVKMLIGVIDLLQHGTTEEELPAPLRRLVTAAQEKAPPRLPPPPAEATTKAAGMAETKTGAKKTGAKK